MIQKFNRFLPREKKILKNLVKILQKHLAPDKIILFGSRAKGSFYPGSDFDLAVEQAKASINTRELWPEIEQEAGLYKVDIVDLNQVEAGFKNIILQTGKVIYERRD